jgi:hypothetical protein
MYMHETLPLFASLLMSFQGSHDAATGTAGEHSDCPPASLNQLGACRVDTGSAPEHPCCSTSGTASTQACDDPSG